ncbi:hypothetical protein [Brachybacterium sp. P6-10-X1]|uniref:hypothetical protein n=1 Tax=Brachybacterium sp. P6-10-X1 TaxID=1903186 RepID=UPI0012F99191|nr:hypothetical protein [Brachybacterium sp. P6-10-X1]
MSQPPQNEWGRPPSEDPYGQPSPNGGYGPGQPGGYGPPSPNGGYGPGQPGGYGQPSPNGGYGQGQSDGFGHGGSFAPGYGDTGAGPAPQGPQNKGPGKVAIIVCAGCALLVLLLVIVGGGIFLFTRGGEERTGGEETTQAESADEQTSEEATEGATEEATDDETAQEATSEEATAEETSDEATDEATDDAAASDAGTKDSPYALGDTFTIEDGDGGELEVAIGTVNWDATDEVMAVSGSNPEPGEDETYILVPVTMTYHGSGTAEPGLTLMVEYVSSAGNTYSDEYAMTPNDWLDVGTLHDGGTGEWEIGMIVPKDQIQDGAFTVKALMDFSADPVWVAAS